MSTACETVPLDRGLGSLPVEAMWHLFNRHYSGARREVFERDLLQKQHAFLLWRDGDLVGFTSQRFVAIDGHRVTFSGDIIVTPDARNIGTAHFFHQWARAVWNECDWWCALSAGPRTFRVAPTFFHRVTPCLDTDETETERALRHTFAEHVYGAAYQRDAGIVQLPDGYTLREEDQQVREAYPMDAYFRRANPGWHCGDELVSLVSLDPDNWKPVAQRMLDWTANRG